MVDTVLYFEGERGHQFRILRSVKNRFGPTDEIGVFEMTDGGLNEVSNPSALFLEERERDVSGSAVFAGMEGTRPVLVEIQALIAPTAFAAPRRAVVGWDGARLAMILAVLETRCGMAFGTCDDVSMSPADSGSPNRPPIWRWRQRWPRRRLTGRYRRRRWFSVRSGSPARCAVARADARLKEAAKLGFATGIVPPRRSGRGRGGRGDRGRPRRRSAKTAATAERHRERAEIRECLTFRSPSPTSLSWACC